MGWRRCGRAKLVQAAASLGVPGIADALAARHIDLFRHAVDAVRLPIPELGLAELAAYFGVPKISAISSGLAALHTSGRTCGPVILRCGRSCSPTSSRTTAMTWKDLVGVHAANRELQMTPTSAPRSGCPIAALGQAPADAAPRSESVLARPSGGMSNSRRWSVLANVRATVRVGVSSSAGGRRGR
jgi:hypothetical protein